MKRIFYLRGWLMPALLILALPVLAQVAAPPTKPDKGRDDNQHPVDTAKLAQAVALYQQGRFKDAESLFSYIRRYDKQDKSAPDYVAALYYDALCRYALEDWRGFADAAGSPWLQKADLTPELRADLDAKRVGAIYFSGDFEGVLSNAADFYVAHPGSPEVRGVLEFQMASLYERGVKKFYGSGDRTKTNALSQDCAAAEKGYSNLVEFLNVAVALDEDNYQVVPRRNLTSELKQALTALEWEGNFTNEDAAAIRQSLRNDPRLQEETMPDTMQADIELRHDETCLQLHQFKEVLAGIGDFAQRHPDSKHLWTASEYQMAALYEGGIKKLAQAGYLKGIAWTNLLGEGQSNLVSFLNLAGAMDETNYVSLPERSLKEEIVKAQTALGNEASAMQSLPAAEKEDAAFRNVELHYKLQPLATDDNLQRMRSFLNQYPQTRHYHRVQYDMGEAAFEEGWRLTYSEKKRAVAAPYLTTALGLFNGVMEDKTNGVSTADVREARMKMLCVYYAQRDWTNLCGWAAQLLTNAAPGGKEWVEIKVYHAAGLTCEHKLKEAASELDEVLTIGFKGNPSHDGPLVTAAGWRIVVAKQTHDEATAQRIAQLVAKNRDCYGSIQRTFTKQFKDLLPQPEQISK